MVDTLSIPIKNSSHNMLPTENTDLNNHTCNTCTVHTKLLQKLVSDLNDHNENMKKIRTARHFDPSGAFLKVFWESLAGIETGALLKFSSFSMSVPGLRCMSVARCILPLGGTILSPHLLDDIEHVWILPIRSN